MKGDGAFARAREDFPILARRVHGHRLVYLDSAASSLTPAPVIEAMSDYYRCHHSNVHRGAHTLAEEATSLYEGARAKVAAFVGAADPHEVVFTKNATEALNVVAQAWGGANLGPGDRILVSTMEHHANIVPWFMVAARTGARVEWIPVTDEGELDLDALGRLAPGARVVAVTAASNVLGTITPVAEICRLAHEAGALAVVDAAQAAPHLPLDLAATGADAVAFSAHKMLGPTGLGVLWGRRALLEEMPPFLGGGSMIADVTLDGFTPAPDPAKFEAGTMPIAEAVGAGAAVDYLTALGRDAVRAHEVGLLEYALAALEDAFGDKIAILGPRDPQRRTGLVSFTLGDVHPHDISTIVDGHGVAIRAGHHCAKPLMARFDVVATARASVYVYNTRDDVDVLVEALQDAVRIFGL